MSLFDLGRYAGKAGKKAAEMGRFFASEWLREPGAQKMLIGKAEAIAEPFLRKGIDQLSTAIRPKRNYKTNRKDLDGSGLLSNLTYGFNYAPWTRPQGGRPPKKGKGAQGGRPKRAKGVDVHKAIGKLPKPRKGWTLPGHNYTGPYNPLEDQLRYAQHDVDYSVCGNDRKCKNKADSKMVKSLDAIPWKERQWGHALARNVIDVKQKLGLGFASPPFGRLGAPKNGRRF